MTTFYLVRHASHDLLGHVLAGRRIDVPLNQTGRLEASMLAFQIERGSVVRVISSPRRRARETSGPIAEALRLDVDIAPELDEHDAGEWSGLAFDVLQSDPLWRRWNEQRGAMRPPGGETMAELQARVVGYLRVLRDRHPGETLVLVSHAEPIRAALMYAGGIDFDDFLQVEVPVASMTRIIVDGHDLARTPLSRLTQRGAA